VSLFTVDIFFLFSVNFAYYQSMKKSSTKVCFIVNPTAGKEKSAQYIDWLDREARNRWDHYEIVITRKNEPVVHLAALKSEDFDLIVACGGDGTVNQVVNGIVNTNTVLGVLPIGTGNDFAKSLKLNIPLPDCIDLLYIKNTTSIDLIQFEGDAEGWSANTLGIGLDGWANYYSKSYKWLKGPVIYILGALKAAFTFRGANFNLTVDGNQQDGNYLMITACNGKWEGGKFYLAPQASVTDGLIDLITINKIPLICILAYLLRFRRGPAKWMKNLNSQTAKVIELKSDTPLAVHADGEHLNSTIQNLTVRAKKGILEVVSGY
jgi:diacylglycerol kinase (ATP)